MIPLAVHGMGAITALGENVPLSVASIYTNAQRFAEINAPGIDGEKVFGASVMMGDDVQGVDRLRVLSMLALQECGAQVTDGVRLPVVVLAPALAVYGRDADWLLSRMLDDVDLPLDRGASSILAPGRGAEVDALAVVGRLLVSEGWPACFLLGVDSLVVASRLAREVAVARIASSGNPTGFLPGEAGAALLLSLGADRAQRPGPAAILAGSGHCAGGPGYLTSAAVLSEAADRALVDAQIRPEALGAVCHDGAGDWAQLEELALADTRQPLSLTAQAQRFIPAVSTGEVGAASGVLSLVTLSFLLMKGVLQRPALAMFCPEGASRGAAVLVPASGPRAPRSPSAPGSLNDGG